MHFFTDTPNILVKVDDKKEKLISHTQKKAFRFITES